MGFNHEPHEQLIPKRDAPDGLGLKSEERGLESEERGLESEERGLESEER
jgi:hypothetical protein